MIRKLAPLILVLFFVVGFPLIAFAQGALPDATDPAASGSFVWRLYKAGHLIPAVIVGCYFALAFTEKRIAWLRTGYRKVYVAAALAGLGMLAERVANGTTPNVGMLMGALGAGFTMWMKTHGEPKVDEPTRA
jgi:hypothetical protein